MTVHILIQCSKSKSVEPSQSLIWDNEMDHNLWNKNWNSSSNRIEVRHLYTGRAIKSELEVISSRADFNGYVISAGAGLVSLDDKIPSYEATFFADDGPDCQNWSTLPNGGLKNLQINDDDVIVTFAAPIYHRALFADPEFDHQVGTFARTNDVDFFTSWALAGAVRTGILIFNLERFIKSCFCIDINLVSGFSG